MDSIVNKLKFILIWSISINVKFCVDVSSLSLTKSFSSKINNIGFNIYYFVVETESAIKSTNSAFILIFYCVVVVLVCNSNVLVFFVDITA